MLFFVFPACLCRRTIPCSSGTVALKFERCDGRRYAAPLDAAFDERGIGWGDVKLFAVIGMALGSRLLVLAFSSRQPQERCLVLLHSWQAN